MTVSPTVTTLSSVKSKKDQVSDATTLIGVQTADSEDKQVTVSEVTGDRPALGITDAFFGVPDSGNDSLLPDLGSNRELTITDVLNQTQEAHSTEEELDAADTLLSLSDVRDTFNPSLGIDNTDDIDENALLMPIGGGSIIEDVAPEPLRLEQVDVDEGIARMIATEEHEKLSSLSGVQTDGGSVIKPNSDADKTTDTVPVELSGIQESGKDSSQPAEGQTAIVDVSKGTPVKKSTDVVTKKGSRGAFKSQLYGLRRPAPKDRSYKCKICDITKRSMEDLNDHHRRRHGKQTCEVCGKQFNLATTLAHHMYSHFPRKFQCERCDFHCRFQSELDTHMITHRENPSYQCMYPKCGRWFKCKGELTLHIEVHNKLWYDCSKCDFSTKLVKYLKEHEKSHKNELPYSCNLCGQWFLWRSGVKRHKEKDHKTT